MRTLCFESQCFVDWKPLKERTLPSLQGFAHRKEQCEWSFIVLCGKFIEETDKRQSHYFLSLVRLDPQLDSQLLRLDPPLDSLITETRCLIQFSITNSILDTQKFQVHVPRMKLRIETRKRLSTYF